MRRTHHLGHRMVSRREILGLLAVAPIAGCTASSTTTANTIAQQVVSDVGLIATGLQAALPGLTTTAGISATTVSKVGGYVSQLQSLASSVTTSLTTTSAQPVIQQVISVIGQIAAVAGPALPPPWGTAILAAEVLLPVIASAVGIAMASTSAAAPAMTPSMARTVLSNP